MIVVLYMKMVIATSYHSGGAGIIDNNDIISCAAIYLR